MKQSFCHCKERSEEADNVFVIASLNAEAFRRGNLLFWGRDYDTFHKIRDWLSPTHSPTLLGWRTRLAFANTVRTPLVCKPRLPRLPYGRLAMTERLSLRGTKQRCNLKWDCHGLS